MPDETKKRARKWVLRSCWAGGDTDGEIRSDGTNAIGALATCRVHPSPHMTSLSK